METSGQKLCIGAQTSGGFVMLDAEERRRHLYVVGQTGTGKSTLLLNLIAQDLAAGEGVALLDPHGDLVESVLAHVPRARTNDLVYINPADTERPIGFNPLACVPERLKPLVADGVVSAFRHVWPESWGLRRNRSECTVCGCRGRDLVALLLRGRVGPFREQHFCFVPFAPRCDERRYRIRPKGEQFLLAPKSVFHPPELRPFRMHEQVQPAAIRQLEWLRARLGSSYGKVSQRHRDRPSKIPLGAPPFFGGAMDYHERLCERQSAKILLYR